MMTRRLRCAMLLLATVVLGLAVRFAAVGVPRAIAKYGGSALWAMAIFWLVTFTVPRSPLWARTVASLVFAFGIELFKLVRASALDAFRLTLPGKLLLGRVFSIRDLIAYLLAILVAAALDRVLFRAAR